MISLLDKKKRYHKKLFLRQKKLISQSQLGISLNASNERPNLHCSGSSDLFLRFLIPKLIYKLSNVKWFFYRTRFNKYCWPSIYPVSSLIFDRLAAKTRVLILEKNENKWECYIKITLLRTETLKCFFLYFPHPPKKWRQVVYCRTFFAVVAPCICTPLFTMQQMKT